MKLTAEQFNPHIGQTVQVQLDDGSMVELVLDEVVPRGEASPVSEGSEETEHRSFFLDLSGARDPVIRR